MISMAQSAPSAGQVHTNAPSERSRLLRAEKNDDDLRLLAWTEILEWQQDNEFVLTGYRKASFSYSRSLESVLGIHNETVNIWSHICAAVVFLGVTIWVCMEKQKLDADGLAVTIYFASCVVCFVCSFIYHIFLDHTSRIRTLTCRFDYLGIVIPLYGTTIASTHFGLKCEPGLRDTYQVIATISAIACAIATLHPSFSKHRHLRTGLYCLLGMSSFLPIIHGVALHGIEEHNRRMGFGYYLALGMCHATGAMMYAARVPERWYPRCFDVWGSSHQIMHVMVVIGAVAYGTGVLRAARYWRDERAGRCVI